MGLFGLFGGDKPNQKNIDKQVNKVKERYAQPEMRRAAMDKLLEWGTTEALEGVLQRFSVVVQSPHWDEQEKKWLVEELAERGPPARQALVTYLKSQNHIAYAAKALRKLCSQPEYVEEIKQALMSRDPDDYRSVQAKQELVAELGKLESTRALDAILPYLDDHGDDVRCTTLDVIEENTLASAFGRVTELITEDFHSARVLRHAAGVVSRLELEIDPEKPLAPEVTEDFAVQNGKLVQHNHEA